MKPHVMEFIEGYVEGQKENGEWFEKTTAQKEAEILEQKGWIEGMHTALNMLTTT